MKPIARAPDHRPRRRVGRHHQLTAVRCSEYSGYSRGNVPLCEQFIQRANAFPRPLVFVINTGDLVRDANPVMPDALFAGLE
jgi:hypothetical protein